MNKALTHDGFTAEQLLNCGKLLDETAAAFCLDCSVATLQRDRHINGDNPEIPYIKRGRSVRYKAEDIKKIIDSSVIGVITLKSPNNNIDDDEEIDESEIFVLDRTI